MASRSGSVTVCTVTVLGLAIVVAGLWIFLRPAPFPERIRFGRGVDGGTWHAVSKRLATLLETECAGLEVETVQSDGSVENVAMLESGSVDLALAQGDTQVGPNTRLIVPMYESVLHLVVGTDVEPPIHEVSDLAGRSVAIGAPHSGTAEGARDVLRHAGLADDVVDIRLLDTNTSLAAFAGGEVDAVFHFAALPGEPVKDLLAARPSKLLPLGKCTPGSALDGLRAMHPGFERAVIPTRLYGDQPAEPVGTVAVQAVLACRAGLDDRFVQRVTEIVLGGRVELAKGHPVLARLSEDFDAALVPWSLHPGADDYYHRKDPPFYVRYADPMSLAFTLLLAGVSGVYTLRQWAKRRRKNRIDAYYVEIERVARRVEGATTEALAELRDELEGIRRRAFSDLVRERLSADESFRIFQAFLRGEEAAIRRRLPRRSDA